jgi:hypothetical protein
MMIGLWSVLVAAAFAGPLDPFQGEWGLDPIESDDPIPLLAGMVSGPVATGSAAARYSPDQGAGVGEDERNRVIDAVIRLLGVSSRLALTPDGESVVVTFGGEEPVTLPLGKKWSKVRRGDGSTYKMRALLDGEQLVLERRVKASVLTETFLKPVRPDELFVVVRLDATGLATGLEFRRAYDALHDTTP